MVRHYVKKNTQVPSYSNETLLLALQEIKSGRITLYKASKLYDIPYPTLYTRVKGLRGKICKNKGRPQQLPIEEETKLANGIKTLEKWGFGLSRKEVLELVGKYVSANNLQTCFKDGVPGEDWFLGFKRRYTLSLKIPQNVEYARTKAMDPFQIYGYFELLKNTLRNLDLLEKPERVWNLDETSLSIDPRKSKVVGQVGKPSSRTISTPGKENTTMLAMCNAAGGKAPLLIVFKGLNIYDKWMASDDSAFAGITYAASKKGWMETEIFKNYFMNTILSSIGTKRPVLIIYDGHSTHIDQSIIETAIKENITILKLPPHSSHLLQPLDLSVFKSFKGTWDDKLIKWQRQNLGRKLPKKLISEFVCQTWKSVHPEVISNGFKKAGIYPFSADVIPETAFSRSSLERWNEHIRKQKNTPDQVVSPRNNDLSHEQQGGSFATLDDEDNQNTNSEEILSLIPTNSSKSPDNLHPIRIFTSNQKSTVTLNNSQIAGCSTAAHKSVSLPGLLSDQSRPSVSFEDLLLKTVTQKPEPQKEKKKRVATGSEVLTSQQVLQRLRENEEAAKLKCKKKPNPKKSSKPKAPKQPRKTIPNLSSSDEESGKSPDFQESDEDEIFLNELRNSGPDEDPAILSPDIEINSWVLVKYSTKKSVYHYVGQITGKIDDGWSVKFLKYTKNKFIWPDKINDDVVETEDILKILPIPTRGRRGCLEFGIQFQGYNLQ
jgi:hypothetical protein